MKRNLAILFVTIVLLVIGTSYGGAPDTDNDIHWVAASDGYVPVKAVSAGTTGDGRQVFVCRASTRSEGLPCEPFCAEHSVPGRLREGDDSCYVEYYGSDYNTQYEVLSSGNNSPKKTPRWVGLTSYPAMNDAIYGGSENYYGNPWPTQICRVVVDGETLVGKKPAGIDRCYVIDYDQIAHAIVLDDDVEILIDPAD